MLTKMSSVPSQLKVLSPGKAWSYLALNQLAFPGLGTVMAGRRFGYMQATIMVIGFILTTVYFLATVSSLVSSAMDLNPNNTLGPGELRAQLHHYAWIGKSGGVLSAIAWCWSLISSISMVRHAQKEPPVLGIP